MFNYEVKKSTYQQALSQAKIVFMQNDMQTGLYYLQRAISLNAELVAHCIVPEIKSTLIVEGQKLNELVAKVNQGINPFLQTQQTTNQGQSTQGAMPYQGANQTSQGAQSVTSATSEQGQSLKFFQKEYPSITLDDVAGLEEVKSQIRLNVITPINNPDLFYSYKDEAGCQILMYGPPGCGKSFVAEAIAGELKCAYAIINVYDILEKYVGEAPKKIASIFEEAKQFDNCLIFFDELDALFASRDSDDSAHTKDVLTAFLTCLSGFHAKKEEKRVRVIIGATNRPWALDSAVIRGKRFDTHIYVGLPDATARDFLIRKSFKNRPSLIENTDITTEEMVELYDGYSGADISAMIEKLKTRVLRRGIELNQAGLPITKEDVLIVKSETRNSVTKESLELFESFKKGEI